MSSRISTAFVAALLSLGVAAAPAAAQQDTPTHHPAVQRYVAFSPAERAELNRVFTKEADTEFPEFIEGVSFGDNDHPTYITTDQQVYYPNRMNWGKSWRIAACTGAIDLNRSIAQPVIDKFGSSVRFAEFLNWRGKEASLWELREAAAVINAPGVAQNCFDF